MDRLQRIEIFVRVAQCLSFSRAAEQLGLPRSTVSAAIQALEVHVQTSLLQRTTRKIQLTADGKLYLEWCLQLLSEIDDTEQRLRGGQRKPSGKLSVSVPGRIASAVIAPHLPEFFRLYPDIQLELSCTDRSVDLIHEGIDCAIRVGLNLDQQLIARNIGALAQGSYASPGYLQRFGRPLQLSDLSGHQVVNYASPAAGRSLNFEYVAAGQSQFLSLPALVSVNCVESYIACACAGLGIIQIPCYDAAKFVQNGELQAVLPDIQLPQLPVVAVYPNRRYLTRRVQVFIEWMQTLFASVMQPVVVANEKRQ